MAPITSTGCTAWWHGTSRFYCITDSAEGLRPEVEVIPLPDLGCEMPRTRQGIWGKSRLWRPDLGGLSGPVLFMDLDVVVTGNLDPFFTYGQPEDVIRTRNANTPFQRLGQTSLFRFSIGALSQLHEEFLSDPQNIAESYVFEQRFVTQRAPGGVTFWPRGWIATFRWHCVRTFPINYLLPPKLPRKARVVIFPGGLNPADAIVGKRFGNVPRRTPWAHLKAGLRGDRKGSLARHLRGYLRPTPWVRDAWRE